MESGLTAGGPAARPTPGYPRPVGPWQAFAVFAYLDNMLAWLTMRDEAGLDGKETGAAVAWAMSVLIDDLRRRQRAAGTSRKEQR